MSIVIRVRIAALTNFRCLAPWAACSLLCTAGCREASKIIGADPPPAQLGDDLKNLPTPTPPGPAALAKQARLETVRDSVNKRFTEDQRYTIAMAAHSTEPHPGAHGNDPVYSEIVSKRTPSEIKQISERRAAARVQIAKQYHITSEELDAIEGESVISD